MGYLGGLRASWLPDKLAKKMYSVYIGWRA
jgi:hypothetical protein